MWTAALLSHVRNISKQIQANLSLGSRCLTSVVLLACIATVLPKVVFMQAFKIHFNSISMPCDKQVLYSARIEESARVTICRHRDVGQALNIPADR